MDVARILLLFLKMKKVQEISIESLAPKKFVKILKDPVKTAEIVNLIYVSDGSSDGIVRKKYKSGFRYFYNSKPLKDKEKLNRIKKLVIPPAWKNVWICALDNGHLQATGLDAKNRKQYRYHHVWNTLRNHTKFYRMLQFGNALPQIRLQLEKDLLLPGLQQKKVLAAVVSLMERTNIRVGNNVYEKLYGSFGITTLKDKHVNISGSQLKFSFKGKKGVMHDIGLKHTKLAKIVKECREIPGKELFQYYNENKERCSIDSGMVNNYIKEISGEDFTAKDFRTWAGTVNAFLAFKELGPSETATETKKRIIEALDKVAHHLGNTRNVCKNYYVHPLIINLYENQSMKKYLDALDDIEEPDNKSELTKEETIIMKILESEKMIANSKN